MRWWIVPLGVAAVLGALIALTMPVGLSVADRSGSPISCGSAMSPQLGTARHEDALNEQLNTLMGPQYHPSDYATQCQSLIARKLHVAIPVAALGGLALAVIVAADVVTARGGGRHRARSAVVSPALGFPAAPMGGAHP